MPFFGNYSAVWLPAGSVIIGPGRSCRDIDQAVEALERIIIALRRNLPEENNLVQAGAARESKSAQFLQTLGKSNRSKAGTVIKCTVADYFQLIREAHAGQSGAAVKPGENFEAGRENQLSGKP